MFKFLYLFILAESFSFAQTNLASPSWFKGDHFVIYNKCKTAVLFCESTQQVYTFCNANKNCQGLYVNPGDTFFLNYEDKAQIKTIVADITFQGYFTTALSHTFQPVQNCIPPQALQIAIPLSAVPGSSFQINAANPVYDPTENPVFPLIPLPIYVYVGGQQPNNTTSLANFTGCPVPEIVDTTSTDVSVKEISSEFSVSVYPNPTTGNIKIEMNSNNEQLSTVVCNAQGRIVFRSDLKTDMLDLGILEPGFYYLSIYMDKKRIKTSKFVIVK